ncbi:CehA/McbA family metallohydrolase [Edaphobacter albus]|uniref:CehA/McbA family metallohydrolase n=1 Tax=Edaphobacter sp. 4G125 TaxID=2763071 RepID=UPI0021033C50|nr:CehA/McbA family metallohydrolase [Edaphobacter sp. 4G125]
MKHCFLRGVGVYLFAFTAVFGVSGLRAQEQRKPDLVLKGTITEANRETYVEVPFTVPAGVVRVSVDFHYTGHEKKATIDLGLLDNERFRGWSGGNKSAFTVSETDATPSYLPGPIRPGVWKLLLGVPSMPTGVRSEYVAKVYFGREGEPVTGSTFGAEAVPGPVREGPGWFRGDLHMHDAHSDGSCTSQMGKKVPCPLYKTVEAASARGLDFIAITDHNTMSHFDAMRELAPYFDKMLLIPGREITTFQGHANVFGTTEFIDFRLTSKYVPTFNDLLNEVEKKHALISINHPGLPTGAECMGCGWSVKNTDFSRVHVIEAINGDNADNAVSGVPFWQKRLNDGLRVTAVGGSDNHDATLEPNHNAAIGKPTTVVYAANLSERAILDGIRAGHAFVDTLGSHDRAIEFTASVGGQKAMMGDVVKALPGEKVHFVLTLKNLAGAKAEVVRDGVVEALGGEIKEPIEVREFDQVSDDQRHWVRVNVRGANGRLLILGNPVYLNF